MSSELETILTYHQETKHHFHRYARGPGQLDWDSQPDPFRRYLGAPVLPLERVDPTPEPLYDPSFFPGHVSPAPLDRHCISQLFFDSLALSAWKSIRTATWSLRVNPSSGNLHPTEGYLLCGPVPGLTDSPVVCHYASREHALEVRARVPPDLWQALLQGLPPETVLVGLSSIHWREAWKYGERAYRYCQHDVGHALAAVSLAAAGLGWRARLLDGLATEQLAALLGIGTDPQPETEEPDALMALLPQGCRLEASALPEEAIARFPTLAWQGTPNRLSSSHVPWGRIAEAAQAARKPPTSAAEEGFDPPEVVSPLPVRAVGLRPMIRQRRSAVDMDAVTTLPRDVFYHMLIRTLPVRNQFPFSSFPWRPRLHMALLVHRVTGVSPGLYFLVRDPAREETLRSLLRPDAAWKKPEGCPDGMRLHLLLEGDAREAARHISCHQEIASDGCFSLGMIAEFEEPLRHHGPWYYPRLFWEAGLIGQVLYLEAEAAGIRATGIGCYFDDPMHELLGLEDRRYQDLYHFTVGGPVEDKRLTALPAYP
ncbi:MAG: SagB/ThcOx family dehydrogenase [Planctomycetes bacterium]|nr:SagB/ThcOx family dehydrogenase [Planctomycetota bacterium]